MACGHFYAAQAGGDEAFTVDASRVTFGRGCLAEVGDRVASHGTRRVGLFTDRRIRQLAIFETVSASLRKAGLDVVVFDDVRVEPTDGSFREAVRFANEAKLDGYVSLGGGSVIDTCKAANLYSSHPAEFDDYVNAPVGAGRAVPGALKPHLACPTTSGTGSEVTGIAIFDYVSLHAKTGIASVMLRPTEALVDPDCTDSLPSEVVAASGMDVLCHALESYTARPFVSRAKPGRPTARPMSQGANPWSDLGCREALRLLGKYLRRAVEDATDREAREQTMWAATLAGIAFGNAGVHVPHAMAYAVAGNVKTFRPSGYPQDEPIVPHGMAVVVNAPSVFRFTAPRNPARHLEAAALLGRDVSGTSSADAGEVLGKTLSTLMQKTHIPNGIGGVGYGDADLQALAEGTFLQQRLLQNAPAEITKPVLVDLFRGAMTYW
ncbi:Alcohol dehydrogenase [Labilithrix luteola]|uniref:hydroxyacid-oxoacid transhydrogenase n=1 Tax=Labilithrix luteola TaxID=1391654 RepID=A0A0K1Q1N1_9BACT|nr:hydroxyacid-oxoacid transhydrogenase [Labilithrix luteola]AKU99700.1 Alcohol dehydrogenase [Labilithrix luteola]